jgi:Ran GTPase-activating protein (RanGAP) involved in mRNA processing and transport
MPNYSNPNLDQMSIFLWNNKKLETLEMRNCLLDDQGAEALADGIARNSTLRHLDISSNRIGAESMKRWEEILGHAPLKYLDISCNNLYDEGAMCVIRGLLAGWTVSQAEAKLAPPEKRWVAG